MESEGESKVDGEVDGEVEGEVNVRSIVLERAAEETKNKHEMA